MSAPVDSWEYGRWVTVISRSLRLNPAEGVELSAVEDFLNKFRVSRPWLKQDFAKNAYSDNGGFALDNPQAISKNIEVIGRDLTAKIPLQDVAEVDAVDDLIAATGNRRFGVGSNTIGSEVAV